MSEIEEKEQDKIFYGLIDVFEKWKQKDGIYPACQFRELSGSILFRSLYQKQEPPQPAKEYEKKSGKSLKPWECDDYARTPIRLFDKLFAEENDDLVKLLKKHGIGKYPHFLATALLMTHEPDSKFQSADVIDGALKLTECRLRYKDSEIKIMEPLATETFNKRRGKRLKDKIKTEETDRRILEAYHEETEDGIRPKNLQKLIALNTGVKESRVSKCLKRYGLNRASRKKVS